MWALSAAALTIAFGSWPAVDGRQSGEVTFDPGTAPGVAAVRHRERPDLDFLGSDLAPTYAVLAGRRLGWTPTGSTLDPDEAEIRYRLDDPGGPGDPGGPVEVELSVRHTFAASWVQRYVLTNASTRPVRIDELGVGFGPGPGCLGWALAAGAEAYWCVQPADGAGPLLAATLQFGEIVEWQPADPAPAGPGWRTGPIELPPGGRYVLQWIADWYASAADFRRRRATMLPEQTELTWPQPADVEGVDLAVLTDPGLTLTQEEGRTVLAAERPGRFGFELRGPRGTVRSALTWVEPLDAIVSRVAGDLLDGPRTAAGVVRLADSAAGLVLQRALTDRACDRPELAAEALERWAAGLVESTEPGDVAKAWEATAAGRLGVFDIAFLAGESLRTGDPECVAAARDAVSSRTRAEPGLGLAATALSVAELAAGRSIRSVRSMVEQLGRLASVGPHPGPGRRPEDWGRLELALIVRRPGSGSDRDDQDGAVLAGAVALGAAVGCGLPGEPLAGPSRSGMIDPVGDGYAAALLGLIGEDLAAELESRWSLRPQALAERLRRRALAHPLDAHPLGADDRESTLAWLVLSQPPG